MRTPVKPGYYFVNIISGTIKYAGDDSELFKISGPIELMPVPLHHIPYLIWNICKSEAIDCNFAGFIKFEETEINKVNHVTVTKIVTNL